MRELNHCPHGMSHPLTGWVTQNQWVFESSLNWVLTTVPWGDGLCQNTSAGVHRLNLLEPVFLQRTLGAWIFLHVKEVWLHVSSWDSVYKYMEKEEKPSKVPLLENDSGAASIMEWLFHDREQWEMVLSLPFQYISFTMILSFRHLGC